MAKGIPQALQMSLDTASARGLDRLQQKALRETARKIAANCFEKDSKLDLQICPRL